MNEEMTPEEIQAQANSAKIRHFVGNIGWQFAVFAVVVYATVQANTIANYMLDGYTWILAISFISYFIIAIHIVYSIMTVSFYM